MAADLRCAAYCECSALTQTGLKNVFEVALRVVLSPAGMKARAKRGLGLGGSKDKPVPTPPVLPKGVPAPWINIVTPHVEEDYRKMIGELRVRT
jgi:hypothetical protein